MDLKEPTLVKEARRHHLSRYCNTDWEIAKTQASYPGLEGLNWIQLPFPGFHSDKVVVHQLLSTQSHCYSSSKFHPSTCNHWLPITNRLSDPLYPQHIFGRRPAQTWICSKYFERFISLLTDQREKVVRILWKSIKKAFYTTKSPPNNTGKSFFRH